MCEPSASPEVVNGEPQDEKSPPSSEQVSEPSLAVKLNEALWSEVADPFAGPEVIEMVGGTVSTVKWRDLIRLTLPGASIARTKKVWPPSVSGGRVYLGLHGANSAASTWHSKVEPTSFAVVWKVGLALLITASLAGPAVIVATGGLVSAVKLLKIENAGFGLRSNLSSPALEQKLHRLANADDGSGSRHRNQNRRPMFHELRWLRISL